MSLARALYRAVCEAEIARETEAQVKYDHRDYFGASQLGKPCKRQMFLAFRKAGAVARLKDMDAAEVEVSGARYRLFNRGHMEEDRFLERIRPFFREVWPVDPETGQQWEISNCEGMFKGHMDGKARDLIVGGRVQEGLFLLEFKTHNGKSFDKLAGAKRADGTRPWSNGVESTKPEHYAQMQAYMLHDPEIRGAFYFAVNKDTDEWYIEFVPADRDTGVDLLNTVAELIWADTVPPRMDKASPIKNFYCAHFCDFTAVCFGDEKPVKSCRTCEAFSYQGAAKHCRIRDRALEIHELSGCSQYEPFRV